MARDKREEVMRHDGVAVVQRRPITQRNMVSPARTGESFLGSGESTVVQVKRDRRGKRSIQEMLLSMPNDASRASYAMERIAAFEDQIARVLELCTPEARAIILRDRPSLKRYWNEEEDPQ